MFACRRFLAPSLNNVGRVLYRFAETTQEFGECCGSIVCDMFFCSERRLPHSQKQFT